MNDDEEQLVVMGGGGLEMLETRQLGDVQIVAIGER
jgi:hypothetical protein